jgi:hypothetical protein
MVLAILPGGHIYLAMELTDMEKGLDGLSMLARRVPKQDPFEIETTAADAGAATGLGRGRTGV